MMQRTIAIAGLGAAARTIHLPAYAQLTDLKVVGGVDPMAREGDFPFPLFRSPEEMLERTKPDILAVVTPTDTHYALSRLGLLAGCHVFCEKPFMPTLQEATDLIALCQEAKRWVVVNNQYRFMEIHHRAKEQIGRPDFGDLLFLSAHQTFFTTESTEAGWRGRDPRRTCKEFGTHIFDLCRFFFDEDPLALTACMPRGKDPQGPDLLNLIQLDFSGDRVAHITLDRLCRGPNRYLTIRLDGSQGCLETSLGGTLEFSAGLRGSTRRPYVHFDLSLGGRARLFHGDRFRKIAADPLDLFAHATSRLLRTFLQALDQGDVPPCHAEDNLRTLALMLAAYESAEKRMTVEMSYPERVAANCVAGDRR
jgi:predicted dehydrogenase